MSFGVSIGDFIQIIDLTARLVRGCREAPANFAEAGRSAESLHLVLQKLEEEVRNPESILKREGNAQHFEAIITAFHAPLKQLDDIILKYSSLKTGKINAVDRLRFPKKTVDEIRHSLTVHTANLTAFLQTVGLDGISSLATSLNQVHSNFTQTDASIDRIEHGVSQLDFSIWQTNMSVMRMEDGLGNIDHQLGQVANMRAAFTDMEVRVLAAVDKVGAEIRIGSRANSLLSDHPEHPQDDKFAWKLLRRALLEKGFTSKDIVEHQNAIAERLTELVHTGQWESQAPSEASSVIHESSRSVGIKTDDMMPMSSNYRPPDVQSVDSHAFEDDYTDDSASTAVPEARIKPLERNGIDFDDNISDLVGPAGSDTATRIPVPSNASTRELSTHQTQSELDSAYSKHPNGHVINPKGEERGVRTRLRRLEGKRTFPPIVWHYRNTSQVNERFMSTFDHKKMSDAKRLGLEAPLSREMKVAAAEGNLTLFREFLSCNTADAYTCYILSLCLEIAASRGRFRLCQLLLANGANPNTLVGDSPALQTLIRLGSTKTVRLFLEYDADVHEGNIRSRRTALHEAAMRGRLEIVELLLQYHAIIDAFTLEGRTPLYMAARGGHVEIVKTLLKEGAQPDSLTNAGYSAIYKATDAGNYEIVDALLRYGARVDQPEGPIYETCLFRAVRNNDMAMVRLFLKHGIDPNIENRLKPRTREFFLTSGSEKKSAIRAHAESRPLQMATSSGYYDIMTYLLENGSKTTWRSAYWRHEQNALNFAADKKATRIIEKHDAQHGASLDANVAKTAGAVRARRASYAEPWSEWFQNNAGGIFQMLN